MYWNVMKFKLHKIGENLVHDKSVDPSLTFQNDQRRKLEGNDEISTS